jgi:hypothetical protein
LDTATVDSEESFFVADEVTEALQSDAAVADEVQLDTATVDSEESFFVADEVTEALQSDAAIGDEAQADSNVDNFGSEDFSRRYGCC